MSRGLPKQYEPVDAKQRSKTRRCELCKTKLSTYNENRYCFAHMAQGWKTEFQKDEERRQKHAKALQKSREDKK